MKKLFLLVLTGSPSSGKTSIANELEKFGFIHISTDEIRKKMYPNIFPLDIKYPENWIPIWDLVCKYRDDAIKEGLNVIIDSCAQNKYLRDLYFTVPDTINKLHLLHKELIWLNVDNNQLINRENIRERDKMYAVKIIDAMKQDSQNPLDYTFDDVKLFEYRNNSIEDQKAILLDIKKRLQCQN